MKKILIISIFSCISAFVSAPVTTYANTTNMPNYYPSPTGYYTKVHLINLSVNGPNENNCFCAQSTDSNTETSKIPPSGVKASGLCDTGASTTGTLVKDGGTPATYPNAGAIFADPSTGFLEICRSDGTAASYPGACFNRFMIKTDYTSSITPANACPGSYHDISSIPPAIPNNQPFSLTGVDCSTSPGDPSCIMVSWTCCYTGP